MTASIFNSGGSSLVSTKKVQALYEGVMRLYAAEQLSNRDASTPTNYVSYTVTGAAQLTFAATLNLPTKAELDAATNRVTRIPRDWAAGYLGDGVVFLPGTGELSDTLSLPQAVLKLAENINYYERQIVPNVVITQANQVTVTENQDTGAGTISINFPVAQVMDPATGTVTYEVFDYLFVV